MENLPTIRPMQEALVKTWNAYFASIADFEPNTDYSLIKLGEEFGECMEAALNLQNKCRMKKRLTPEDAKAHLAEELCDLIGTVALVADMHQIDLQTAMEKKWLKTDTSF